MQPYTKPNPMKRSHQKQVGIYKRILLLSLLQEILPDAAPKLGRYLYYKREVLRRGKKVTFK